jgi:hypothetical protein
MSARPEGQRHTYVGIVNDPGGPRAYVTETWSPAADDGAVRAHTEMPDPEPLPAPAPEPELEMEVELEL